MTKPVTIPNTFATATTAIPLSNLDADFSTVATALNDANTYSNYAPDTGSANAYVVTLSGVSTTYSAGLRIQFKAGNANTTASTLNVNGGGAKNITYQDATAIASGTIAANSIVDVMYDGTQFLLMNDPAGATGGDVVGPSSATDNAIVRFDGATGKLVQNSVVTIADSTGDVSGVGQLNATTVDATNIEVTNIKAKDGTAAASIADSTGVISITSNPVLSGGTANGVLYLNGSKVATSGSALTFDGNGLVVTKTTATFGIPVYQFNTGAINGIFTGDTTLGTVSLGSYTNHPIAFYVNNVRSMDLTSTGLGIGTSSPGRKLEVTTASPGYGFRIGDGTSVGVYDIGRQSDGLLYFYGNQSGFTGYVFSGVNGERMRLDSSGNLGIGTSSPTQRLTVSTSVSDVASFISSDTNCDVYLKASGTTLGNTRLRATGGDLVFITGLNDRMRLDSSGNLGLGVAPSAWVGRIASQVYSVSLASPSGSPGIGELSTNRYLASGGVDRYIYSAPAMVYQQDSGAHKWYTAPSGTAGNAISFTQAMTLDASGNLGVGETSPSTFGRVVSRGGTFSLVTDTSSQRRLSFWSTSNGNSENAYIQVQNDGLTTNVGEMLFATRNTGGTLAERARITSGGILYVNSTDNGFTSAVKLSVTGATGEGAFLFKNDAGANQWTGWVWNTATSGDNLFILFMTEAGGTGRGSITYNRAGGLVAYNTTSDYRAKDIIGPVTDTGTTIDALKVYNGKMKGATQARPMLIAHEAQEHAPYAVSGVKDEVNEDGTPKFQQIDVSSLVPLLLAEIQSLRQRVALLEGN